MIFSGVFASSTTAANLVCVTLSVLQAYSATATATAIATATESQLVPQLVRGISRAGAATSQAAFHYTPPVVADGKVDVFLDLACPDSAAAWPTIKQVVWEYGFRTEFVIHILPASQSQVAFEAAKALQVLRMYSADSHECALFIDAMLDHQALILNETDDEYEFSEEVLVKGAVVGGRVTEDQFKREMEDPEIDHLVTHELEAAASLGVHSTPTVVLNGIHTMRLVGVAQLRNFELFVDSGMVPPQPLHDIEWESAWESIDDDDVLVEEGADIELESAWVSIDDGDIMVEEGADFDDIRLSSLDESGELFQGKPMSATA